MARSFWFCFVFYSNFFAQQLLLVSGYLGVGDPLFLMKGISFFLKGTNLEPLVIE